mmetsp:Transcript_32242/g.96670  ORF Transcript_32242/g.96670 Transcript_32242/m.96670 type:complete len:228 (-) Transcript_32242:115-798(-)
MSPTLDDSSQATPELVVRPGVGPSLLLHGILRLQGVRTLRLRPPHQDGCGSLRPERDVGSNLLRDEAPPPGTRRQRRAGRHVAQSDYAVRGRTSPLGVPAPSVPRVGHLRDGAELVDLLPESDGGGVQQRDDGGGYFGASEGGGEEGGFMTSARVGYWCWPPRRWKSGRWVVAMVFLVSMGVLRSIGIPSWMCFKGVRGLLVLRMLRRCCTVRLYSLTELARLMIEP